MHSLVAWTGRWIWCTEVHHQQQATAVPNVILQPSWTAAAAAATAAAAAAGGRVLSIWCWNVICIINVIIIVISHAPGRRRRLRVWMTVCQWCHVICASSRHTVLYRNNTRLPLCLSVFLLTVLLYRNNTAVMCLCLPLCLSVFLLTVHCMFG